MLRRDHRAGRPWGRGHGRKLILMSVVAAAGSLTPAVPAAATTGAGLPGQDGATGVATHVQADGAAARRAVLDYWTPERIAALTQPSSDNPPESGPDGAPWTVDNALARTVGRLFFTSHGEDESCTATVVGSANHNTVVTAAHCVNDTDLLGENNEWTSNVMFVPGYRDGKAPYGKFVGRSAVVHPTWLANDAQSARFDSYDQAFVVLNAGADGRPVQDVVGAAQRIGFDLPGDRTVHQFGYPRAASDPARAGLPEYTGERLAYCTGVAEEYPGTADWPEPRGQWGTACVMGGGSSGGSRMAGFDPMSGLGTVVGVNTQSGRLDASGNACASGDAACTRYLVGPQFTSAITRPLYESAQRSR